MVNKAQAGALAAAILAVLDQFSTGIIPNLGLGENVTVWILLATNILSAVLPKLLNTKGGKQ